MKPIRAIFLGLLGLAGLSLLPDILRHATWLMGSGGLPFIVRDRWDIAAVNILFFGFFLLLTRYRTRIDWRKKNIYTAFIIALFVEMYGFPLTAYFMANLLGPIQAPHNPGYTIEFDFMGEHLSVSKIMIVGSAVTVTGLVLVAVGWLQVYKSGGKPVTGGVYRYSRHPQYLGFLLVTFGWLIHWPTLLTILMWPVLASTYINLARDEEKYMKKQAPKQYQKYMENTPMLL